MMIPCDAITTSNIGRLWQLQCYQFPEIPSKTSDHHHIAYGWPPTFRVDFGFVCPPLLLLLRVSPIWVRRLKTLFTLIVVEVSQPTLLNNKLKNVDEKRASITASCQPTNQSSLHPGAIKGSYRSRSIATSTDGWIDRPSIPDRSTDAPVVYGLTQCGVRSKWQSRKSWWEEKKHRKKHRKQHTTDDSSLKAAALLAATPTFL